ncbi:MAG: response regulator [Planctomycetia bacterium]|nr:response regulator [Planctomycetia bacterium]
MYPVSLKDSHAILLVEDNPADIQITRRALRDGALPIHLIVVRDGQEAVEYLLRHGQYAHSADWRRPDLILLDLNLPRVNGREVLQRVRSAPSLSMVPVVVLSTSNRLEDVHEAYALGANTYFQKPQDFNRFVALLQVIQRYWLDTAILPPQK